MDSQEEVLVGGSSDHVCCSEELPVKHGRIAEKVCTGELERDDAENDIFGERFRTAELRDLAINRSVNKVQGCAGIQEQVVTPPKQSQADYDEAADSWTVFRDMTYLWVSLDNGLSP